MVAEYAPVAAGKVETAEAAGVVVVQPVREVGIVVAVAVVDIAAVVFAAVATTGHRPEDYKAHAVDLSRAGVLQEVVILDTLLMHAR